MKRVLLFAILLVFAFNSCKKDESPVSPSAETTKIPETTKYIESTDYSNYFDGFSSDSTQLLFKKDIGGKYNFKVNDVIAISEGSGLLRKVTGIQTTSTQIIVDTEQGTLEEAIENGTIEYSGALSKKSMLKVEILTDGIKYDERLNKENETEFNFNINKVLYDADNNLSTTNDQIRLTGTFSFTTDIFLKIVVKNFHLQTAKYGFEADNSENLTLEAMVQYSLSKEIELARVTFNPIYFQVGFLPVIIVPDLRIKIGVNGYANAGISSSIQNEFHFEAGSEYTLGSGWQPYNTFTNNYNYSPPSLTANCGARAYIKPEINMALYGVLAGYAYGEAYGKLEANLLQSPWWKLYVGYKLGIGARAEILGHGLFDFILDALIQNEKLVAQATSPANNPPNAPSTPSPADGSTAQSTSPTLSWSCSDPDGDPLTYDVYFGTSNPPTTTIATEQTAKSINRSGLTPNTKYYWKIIAKDNKGTSTSGIIWNFTTAAGGTAPAAPTLSSPTNNATNVSTPPTLAWNASSGAASYTLQVSTNSSFSSYVYNQSGLTSTSQQVSGLNNSTQYFWRVSASNGSGTSAWSSAWNFTTAAGYSNLAQNASFEDDLNFWDPFQYSSGWSALSDNPQSGQKCGFFDFPNGAGYYDASIKSTGYQIPVASGETYYFSFWIREKDTHDTYNTGNTILDPVVKVNGNFYGAPHPAPSQSWQFVDTTITFMDTGNAEIHFQLHGYATTSQSEFAIDNVVFAKIE